ncbi:hypothetical protein ACFLZU_03775 [Thermodesulfobacteriota bacterium]
MARPKKESRELTIKDVEKGIALARKLMASYKAILEDPEGKHPSERQLEAVGKFLKDNGVTLEKVMVEMNKRTANNLDGDATGNDSYGTKSSHVRGMSKKEDDCQLPFSIDEHGNSFPNPDFAQPASPTTSKRQPKYDLM